MDHCARTTAPASASAHVQVKEERSTVLLRVSLLARGAAKREQRDESSLRDIVVRVIKKSARTGRDMNPAKCNTFD